MNSFINKLNKRMKKYLIRKKIYFKSKSKKTKKYIKDESLKNFLLNHSKVQNIDFSKINIPSFLDILSNEPKEEIKLPRFRLNFFSEIKSETEKEKISNFKSFLF